MRTIGGLLLAAWLLSGAAPTTMAAEEVPPATGVEAAPECPPFEAGPLGEAVVVREPGVAPAAGEAKLAPLAPSPAAVSTAPRGEALIALPKRGDGKLPADFELAPGARIASSYFSPILCATVVRVVGPADADVAALVKRTPAGAATRR